MSSNAVYTKLSDEDIEEVDVNLEKAAHEVHKSKVKIMSSLFIRLFRGEKSTFFMRIFAAVFCGVSSFLIIVVNKVVLTTYRFAFHVCHNVGLPFAFTFDRFPSFKILGFGQMIATIVVLSAGKSLKVITYPDCSTSVARKSFPLPVFYFGNLLFGLGGTQKLSLPMFTILRRFAILMTMIGEFFILKVRQPTAITLSVAAMIIGTIVAAIDDLAFELTGYVYVLTNDFFTAANNVCVKQKLDSKDLGKYGLLYYNCLFTAVPMFLITWISGDFHEVSDFQYWLDVGFLANFLGSCFMGFLLMYSTMMCTHYNSALTTTIVGCLKNIFVTYIGMYVGGDYVYSFTNFVGLNISMIGSLVYTYLTFIEKENSTPANIK